MATDANKAVSGLQLQQARLKLLQQKVTMQEGLPHLYGFPWYKWAWEFFNSQNKQNFLCAANQISKSSTQIRKAIHWATAKELWTKLWLHRPLQFWYLYPTKDVATIEFKKKWLPEFLPRGEYVNHPVYGWEEEYQNHGIHALHFNSGVSIYFKNYSQDTQHLQTGTCSAIFADEETPEELYDELGMRLAATDGYYHQVFTATLGQEMWREVIEEHGENEKFPEAAKWQISMYDCLRYMDGTPSPWTIERIKRIEERCKSRAEIDKRVYGKFAVDENRMYPAFDRERNVRKGHLLPAEWHIYAGVDSGSGGDGQRHPAAMTFVAVNPEFTKGRAFRCWRGDGVETTASDILAKFIEVRGKLNCVQQVYDPSDRDFFTIAHRVGETFTPADKGRDSGAQTLNTLFKTGALVIYDDTEEEKKLVVELSLLQTLTRKQRAKDDLIDSLRYAVMCVPWDWDTITKTNIIEPKKELHGRALELYERKKAFQTVEEQELLMIDDEFEAYNELYDVD